MLSLSIIGTRPEAIKMAPVISCLKSKNYNNDKHIVLSTGQHRELMKPILNFFDITPDIDLDLMSSCKTLNDLTSSIIKKLDSILDIYRPDVTLVHGDTTSAASAAIACFNKGLKVGHVEAGLRSGDLSQPWPEEFNRRVIDIASSFFFVPTRRAAENLYKEGVAVNKVHITGNTVIDALHKTTLHITNNDQLKADLKRRFPFTCNNKNIVLVTGHRRENFGDGLDNICRALKQLAERSDTEIIYPVHLNPNVYAPVNQALGNLPNIHLIEPVGYLEFVYLMMSSSLILSDSGGIQEEAPSLSKPLIIMRNITERPEVLDTGLAHLVGTNCEDIVVAAHQILNTRRAKSFQFSLRSPFGDGKASQRIMSVLHSSMYGEQHDTIDEFLSPFDKTIQNNHFKKVAGISL
ncbi:MAG: non-hydrolyzing UDP-N-acetylglucosamine 2-epimerase [Methyloligellaceae bacterium]